MRVGRRQRRGDLPKNPRADGDPAGRPDSPPGGVRYLLRGLYKARAYNPNPRPAPVQGYRLLTAFIRPVGRPPYRVRPIRVQKGAKAFGDGSLHLGRRHRNPVRTIGVAPPPRRATIP